jgi:hypothetical protein
MFAADSLCECNFVLEFNLPKEISSNQDYIKLSVNHVDLPTVEIPTSYIGYKPRPIITPGEIHCIEHYKHIKDVVPFINRWINSVYLGYSRLNSSVSSQLVEAKLYAYKNDGSLFKKWDLADLHPLFNPNITYPYDDVVELVFRFENIIDASTI